MARIRRSEPSLIRPLERAISLRSFLICDGPRRSSSVYQLLVDNGPALSLTVDDAAALALALPEVTEGTRWGKRTWFVSGRAFAWERPLSKADLGRLGDAPPPEGPLLAVRIADLQEKEVLMMDPPEGFFDIEHLRGYPAVLVELRLVGRPVLKAAIAEAWRVCARR